MFSAWSRSRSWATSVSAARNASSARLESSRSVQAPNQRTTAPSAPYTGMLRARNQRYSPSARRKRNSASKGRLAGTSLVPERQRPVPIHRVQRVRPTEADRRLRCYPGVVEEALAPHSRRRRRAGWYTGPRAPSRPERCSGAGSPVALPPPAAAPARCRCEWRRSSAPPAPAAPASAAGRGDQRDVTHDIADRAQ